MTQNTIKLISPFYDQEIVQTICKGKAWGSVLSSVPFLAEDEAFWEDITKALRLSLEKNLNGERFSIK